MARVTFVGRRTPGCFALLGHVLFSLVVGCSASNGSSNTNPNGTDTGPLDAGFAVSPDGGHIGYDIHPVDVPTNDIQPNYDAFFANNPPPMFCGPDGGVAGVDVPHTPIPGGTAECPDDLNREGCACTTIGQTVPCWPGLRVNRDRGVCHDGTTTCMPYDELTGRWGPCMGYTLPTPGVTLGAGACQCFSQGLWSIANTSPCIIGPDPTSGQYYAVSTIQTGGDGGASMCPADISTEMPPFPAPSQAFSTNTLQVDCTGEFQLCFTIRAGMPGTGMAPQTADCVVAQTCTSAWYNTSGATQTMPPLPGWTSTDSACVTRFATTGGYAEMSVVGLSSECEHIDDMGMPYVFNRVTYCPNPCPASNPICSMCGNGGSGGF